MNNNRFLIMLALALVLAGAAAWIAKKWVDSMSPANTGENTVPIVAVALDIPYGDKIDTNHIKMLPWPKDHIPKGAFTDQKLVIGKIAQRAFVAEEVLLEPQVKDHLAGTTLSALIADGMRAVSVRVDDVAGVAGFIAPGNKVDIIASDNKTGRSYLLLSNIKVLAIDQIASTQQDKPAVVRALTLEVSPEDSRILVKGIRNGQLQFALRNPLDDKKLASELVDTSGEEDKNQPQQSFKVVGTSPLPKRLTIVPWPSSQVMPEKEKEQLEKEREVANGY